MERLFFMALHLLIWIPGACRNWTWAPQIVLAWLCQCLTCLQRMQERTVAIPSVSPTSGNENITLDKGTFYVFVAVVGGTKVTLRSLWICARLISLLSVIQPLPGESALCSMFHFSAIPAVSRLLSWLPKTEQGATCSLLDGQGTLLILQHPRLWLPQWSCQMAAGVKTPQIFSVGSSDWLAEDKVN